MIARKFKPGDWVRVVTPGEPPREGQVHTPAAGPDDHGEVLNWIALSPVREDADGPVWLNLRHVLSIGKINPPKEAP